MAFVIKVGALHRQFLINQYEDGSIRIDVLLGLGKLRKRNA
jgi:hypothetical protein